jgi:hypothetical protein
LGVSAVYGILYPHAFPASTVLKVGNQGVLLTENIVYNYYKHIAMSNYKLSATCFGRVA